MISGLVREISFIAITWNPESNCVKTTPQKTRFRDVKYSRIWDADWVDDDRTQSDYNTQKERTLHLVDKWNLPAGRWSVRHQWQRENQDSEKHQHEAQHEHVNVRVVVTVVVVLCCHTHSLHTSQGSRCLRVRLIPSHGHHHACMKWAFSLTSLTSSSPSSPSSQFFIILKQFLLPFNFTEVK